jgi:hypothetical protein
MIEYGLSVSLEEGTPRTPVAAAGTEDEFDGEYLLNCAPIRYRQLHPLITIDSDDDGGDDGGDDGDDDDGGGDGGDDGGGGHDDEGREDSISPRVLFPHVTVRRRLDFSWLSLSPIVPPPTERIVVCDDDCASACCSVGECSVCYMKLPLRSNHIFTMCGHLFCVRCLLKWWDTATTCPICRAELFKHEVDAGAGAAGAGAGAGAGAAGVMDPDAAAEIDDNDGIWLQMRQEQWNRDRDRGMVSSDSDTESESAIDSP